MVVVKRVSARKVVDSSSKRLRYGESVDGFDGTSEDSVTEVSGIEKSVTGNGVEASNICLVVNSDASSEIIGKVLSVNEGTSVVFSIFEVVLDSVVGEVDDSSNGDSVVEKELANSETGWILTSNLEEIGNSVTGTSVAGDKLEVSVSG